MNAEDLIKLARAKYAECLMGLGIPEGAFYGADYPKAKPTWTLEGELTITFGEPRIYLGSAWSNACADIRANLEKCMKQAIENCGYQPDVIEPPLLSPEQWSFGLRNGYIKTTGELTEAGKKAMCEYVSKRLDGAIFHDQLIV